LNNPLSFDGTEINVLVLENRRMLADLIWELSSQISGELGKFYLSDKGSEIHLSERVVLIVDPFSVEPNERDIINKLYSKIKADALGEEMYLSTCAMLAEIEKGIQKLMDRQSLVLESSGIDIIAIFKSMNVAFAYSESLLERLCDYIDICSEYRNTVLFVLVNIKSYLCEEDIELLYSHLLYNKRNVLLLERCESQLHSQEKITIIDKDLCEICSSKDDNIY
jgi:CRISPR-associated protein Csn2